MLLECLAQDHMSFLATMEPQVFMYILSSISEGLTALGGNLNYFTGASHHKNCFLFFKLKDFLFVFLNSNPLLTILWHAKFQSPGPVFLHFSFCVVDTCLLLFFSIISFEILISFLILQTPWFAPDVVLP